MGVGRETTASFAAASTASTAYTMGVGRETTARVMRFGSQN